MAINSLSGIISGIQWPRALVKGSGGNTAPPAYQSGWNLNGNPVAGSFDTTLNGVILSGSSSQVTGQIPFTDPPSGNTYLSRFQGVCNQAVTLILADRLWHNGGYTITSTSAQNSTTPTWPARDIAGATSGDGVFIGLEFSAALGAALTSATISYTNQAGVSGRTGTNITSLATTLTIRSFFPFSLQAGDTGVRSVESLTLGASGVSGTINLVAYREIARLEIKAPNIPNFADGVSLGLPRLYNGSVPFLLGLGSVNSQGMTVSSNVTFSQG